MKSFMPICIDVSQARIVMIGGGKVALQKLRSITSYTRNVHVYARKISPEIKALGVRCEECEYGPGLVAGALMVYGCTDDRDLNRRIGRDGRKAGAIVCVADDPSDCDFVSPAIFRSGEMSVAVGSNGTNAKKAVMWRDEIRCFLAERGLS